MRGLLFPLQVLLKSLGKGLIMPASTGHEVHLFKPEEEEMLLQHVINTPMTMTTLLLGLSKEACKKFIAPDGEGDQDASIRWLKRVFQRHLLFSKSKQIIAQMHFSSMRVKSIKKVFPDARFFLCVRDPQEAIASHMGLCNKSARFVSKNMLEENFYGQIVQSMFEQNYVMYQYLSELVHNHTLSQENCYFFNYPQTVHGPKTPIMEAAKQLNIPLSDKFIERLTEIDEQQSKYVAVHENKTLESLGLTSPDIAEKLQHMQECYKKIVSRWEPVTSIS